MPQPRKLDETMLTMWDAQGLTAVEMHRQLETQGIAVSIDLVRKRLQEVRRASRGEPPTPKPTRKSSATARRQGQLAEAASILEALKEDLENVLAAWGDSFAGSDRKERFQDAVTDLEGIIETLEAVDVSWNG